VLPRVPVPGSSLQHREGRQHSLAIVEGSALGDRCRKHLRRGGLACVIDSENGVVPSRAPQDRPSLILPHRPRSGFRELSLAVSHSGNPEAL
jgi:hypothetical protein